MAMGCYPTERFNRHSQPPKTLQSGEPPLKTQSAPSRGGAKIRPTNQQTQKSFSTMKAGTPLRSEQLRLYSARSSAGSTASDFMKRISRWQWREQKITH